MRAVILYAEARKSYRYKQIEAVTSPIRQFSGHRYARNRVSGELIGDEVGAPIGLVSR
jgi:hypothetical protein